MLNRKKIFVVMPGLKVARTIERTFRALPLEIIDGVIYVDDGSDDDSVRIAQKLGMTTFAHGRNLGYGANQKTCYREALKAGADIVVMVHPDFQYKPELVPAMAAMVAWGGYDVVLGSRVLVGSALKGGMPKWKFVANRVLTGIENTLMNSSLSEFHTGYRAYSRRLLESLPLSENRNDFVFDSEILAQAIQFDFRIGEVSCPAHYFDDMSTITFLPGVFYGLGCLSTAGRLWLERKGLLHSKLFDSQHGKTLRDWAEGREVPISKGDA